MHTKRGQKVRRDRKRERKGGKKKSLVSSREEVSRYIVDDILEN